MKLEYLKLTNFRGFREFEITFDPQFTVLLGGNMAGKTAVLEAAAVALGALLESVPGAPDREITDSEIYQTVIEIAGVPTLEQQSPTEVEATLAQPGKKWTWRRMRDDTGPNTMTDQYRTPKILEAHSQDGKLLDLPIIVQYGTRRNWLGPKDVGARLGVGSRQDGYAGWFDAGTAHGRLAGWMWQQTLVQLQRGSGYIQPQLAAVEAAVKSCINDVTRFWFDVQYNELRLERTGGDIQSFAMLSEGYRNMVAMIADIAWRAAVLNPQHGSEAHLRTEGIALIDELDLHLHPAWQRSIVADLRRTFPKIQFIVTTHSPQIVASVSRSQIRLLERNQLVADEAYVQGRSSDEILEDVFGVTARPKAVQDEIDALYRLIEDEDFATARQHLAALQERLGPDDTAMQRARWILDSEELQSNGKPAAAP